METLIQLYNNLNITTFIISILGSSALGQFLLSQSNRKISQDVQVKIDQRFETEQNQINARFQTSQSKIDDRFSAEE